MRKQLGWGMPRSLDDVMLTADERAELERYAWALLLLADGHSHVEVSRRIA